MNAVLDHADDQAARDLARWLKSVLPPGARLNADSRAVLPGDAFFAYPGERADGRAYVSQALARGAGALLVETLPAHTAADWDVPHRQVNDLKRLCGRIADAFHDQPTARLRVLAVTGTNGKTSCSQWMAHGLQTMGCASAVVGTLGAGRADALSAFGLTTPDALSLQALFARFVAQGIEAVAIEASSIGLHQHRMDGTRIEVAVFTNLTRDHLDYHGTLEQYAQAKARLFAWPALGAAVVNLDDPWCRLMIESLAPGTPCVGYSVAGSIGREPLPAALAERLSSRLIATSVVPTAQGMRIAMEGDAGRAIVDTRLIGRFNVSNLLAVAGTWLAMGYRFDEVTAALQTLEPVPGRLQPVRAGSAHEPVAVVDYAHSPDALAHALDALRPLAAAREGRLWCVFGAGGDRDAGKRPLMAQVAQRLADHVVITSDNPRSESPELILDDIARGLTQAPWLREADRAAAISTVIAAAQPCDVVLIAGKGHESYQEIAGVQHPFDDREHAARALAARPAHGGADV